MCVSSSARYIYRAPASETANLTPEQADGCEEGSNYEMSTPVEGAGEGEVTNGTDDTKSLVAWLILYRQS